MILVLILVIHFVSLCYLSSGYSSCIPVIIKCEKLGFMMGSNLLPNETRWKTHNCSEETYYITGKQCIPDENPSFYLKLILSNDRQCKARADMLALLALKDNKTSSLLFILIVLIICVAIVSGLSIQNCFFRNIYLLDMHLLTFVYYNTHCRTLYLFIPVAG